MQVVTEFSDSSCAPVKEAVEVFFDLFACSVKANGDAVAVCADYDVCFIHRVDRLRDERESVKGLVSLRVDFAPVVFLLLVEVSLVFGGKLVALDLRVEVVVDGVRLHG